MHDRDPDGNGVFDEGNGTTLRLNENAGGVDANDATAHPEISADGRHVVFDSLASNLVQNDSNGVGDVFVHDRDPDGNGIFDEGNGVVRRLSATVARGEGDLDSFNPRISADGLEVVFWSHATNLVPHDGNGAIDVFLERRDPDGDGVLDEKHDPIARMSVDRLGREANGTSWVASLSPDGRYVGLASDAGDLIAGDGNAVQDVFVREAATLEFHGSASSGNTIHFEVDHALASAGGELWVLVSCSGSDGFSFAPGREVELTLDAWTIEGLRMLPYLSGTIDGSGFARTLDLPVGPVAPGLQIWAAPLLLAVAGLRSQTRVSATPSRS